MMLTLMGLGDFLPAQWETFLGARGGVYADDLVTCVKDKGNRPVCRLTGEKTASAQRAGAVAALQRAADRLINLIPAYQAAEVTLVGGDKLYTSFERDPIGKRAGYDGLLGPSAHGWINGAFVLASALAEVPATVTQAVFTPTEAVFARLALPMTAFFNGVAENIDSLIEAYKKAPRALPQVAPETIRVVEEIITQKRQKIIGAGAVIAAGAVGIGAVSALGIAKGVGAAKAGLLMGATLSRPRRKSRTRRK